MFTPRVSKTECLETEAESPRLHSQGGAAPDGRWAAVVLKAEAWVVHLGAW